MHLGIVTYNIAARWDLDTLLAKCAALHIEGVELRTTHAHGVEPSLTAAQRRGVRAKFAASPVTLWGLGSVCEYHSPDAAELQRNIQLSKDFIDLAVDVGAKGVKVRPNNLPDEVPVERTIQQIGEALRVVGEYAAPRGIEIWVEVHGRRSAHPPYVARMLEIAHHPSVSACWNCNATDLIDGSIVGSFDLLRPWIKSVHLHDLTDETYPYRIFFRLLHDMNYDRFTLAEIPESSDPDRVLTYYRALWQAYIDLAG